MSLSVLIAGGGTGGHLYPGIAVARELLTRVSDARVVFVGTAAGIEGRVVPKEGFTLETIRSAGLKGKSLPALLRADKLQKRAARTGFDWPDPAGARAKIDEELAEVETASDAERAEEVGDLLFAAVNWARKLGVEPEAALRAANAKFERRFRAMEDMAGDGFPSLSLEDQEALWQQVKASEKRPA